MIDLYLKLFVPSFNLYFNLFFLTTVPGTLTLLDLDVLATQLLDTTEKEAKDFLGL